MSSHIGIDSPKAYIICTVPKTKDKTKCYPNGTNDQNCYGAEGFVLSCKCNISIYDALKHVDAVHLLT